MNTRYIHNFFKHDAFGGNTFAMEIVDGKLFVGVAHCSDKDPYNKAVGRDIATSYLDELKMKYREDGVEIITIGSDIPSMSKITGFVVDDSVMYHLLIMEGFESGWEEKVISHFVVDVLDVDYMAIEGAEMKNLLVRYYNEIVDNIFERAGRNYIENASE